MCFIFSTSVNAKNRNFLTVSYILKSNPFKLFVPLFLHRPGPCICMCSTQSFDGLIAVPSSPCIYNPITIVPRCGLNLIIKKVTKVTIAHHILVTMHQWHVLFNIVWSLTEPYSLEMQITGGQCRWNYTKFQYLELIYGAIFYKIGTLWW